MLDMSAICSIDRTHSHLLEHAHVVQLPCLALGERAIVIPLALVHNTFPVLGHWCKLLLTAFNAPASIKYRDFVCPFSSSRIFR